MQAVTEKPTETKTPVRLVPRVDVVERETEVRLFAELPGVAPENLELTVHGDELAIIGTREGDSGPERYERHFRLGRGLARDGVEATLEHGLLELVIPRDEQRRRIEIRTSAEG